MILSARWRDRCGKKKRTEAISELLSTQIIVHRNRTNQPLNHYYLLSIQLLPGVKSSQVSKDYSKIGIGTVEDSTELNTPLSPKPILYGCHSQICV